MNERFEFKLTREALYLGAADVAQWMGVRKQTVLRWENGKEPLPDHRHEQMLQLWELFWLKVSASVGALARKARCEASDVVRLPFIGSDRALLEFSSTENMEFLLSASMARRFVFEVAQQLAEQHDLVVDYLEIGEGA